VDPADAIVASTLIESLGGLAADESPRVSVDERGVVTHFAAPRGRSMSVEGISPEDGKDQRALAFVETHAQALGLVSDRVGLNVHAITTTPERSYVRIRQQYDGIPVHGAEIVMQLQPDGSVKSFLSDTMTDTAAFDLDPSATVPGLDRAAASEFALAAANRLLEKAREEYEADIAYALESGEVDAETAQEHLARASASVVELKDEGELIIYAPYVIGDEGENALTWAFKTHDSAGIMLPVQVFVDANSGEVAHLNPLAAHAVDRKVYDNHLNGWDGLPNATLRRTETSGPVTIFDTIFFADFNAHFDILGYTYDYFDDHHGWDGIDGIGGPINSYIRYALERNAYYVWDNGYLLFGTYGCAVSDDMVGHEYTHGVVYNISELKYWRQSGAISESLSDMWGEFIDWTCPVLGNDLPAQRWKFAETVAGGPYRDMKNPPAHSQPDRYQGTYWYYWTPDMTDEEKAIANDIFVHTNSGVGNKLAYLLTDGDTFNGYAISGMGVAMVRSLYWEAVQLMPSSLNYHDFNVLLLDAADNLGLTTAQVNNIQNACEAVEID
jgi:Zn-dependent metalloprotease